MQSYKINQVSHYIAHLKIVEDNKLAMKEFDRRLPFEIEDLAMATGLESTLPSRSAGNCCICSMFCTKHVLYVSSWVWFVCNI